MTSCGTLVRPDFLLYCFYPKVSVDCRICYVPGRVNRQSQCPVLKSLRFRGLSCRLLPTAVVRRSRPDWLYEYFVDDDLNLWIFLYITKKFFLNFFFVMCSKIFKQFFLFKIFFLGLYCRCVPVFFFINKFCKYCN